MIRYALTFLGGSLLPAVMIYLTGGSNRTNLSLGFVLGLSLALLPLLHWRRQAAKALEAFDRGVERFKEIWAGSGDDGITTDVVRVAEGSGGRDRSAAGEKVAALDRQERQERQERQQPLMTGPLVGDVASALANLGTPYKQASRIAQQVASHQKYEGFEEMFRDALAVARKVRVA